MKHLSILGSTGSIGTQTLEVVRAHPSKFSVAGLSTNCSVDELKKQIAEFGPEAVAVMDERKAEEVKRDCEVTVYSGMEGLKKLAALEQADMVVNALVGSVGVEPTYEAIQAGKDIALANKETMVVAGRIITEAAHKKGVRIMPIDSEHSAIFQCLNGEKWKEIKKLTITCSGGPFRKKSAEELRTVTVNDALKHPTWSMGAKITVDSATLMNKGFEVIEAHWLFNVPYEKISVLIHPRSIIHSLVEFVDTSQIAQLGFPDMKVPIQYALSYPQRLENDLPSLDLTEVGKLEFFTPDLERFPCLRIALEAGREGGLKTAVLNAANEIAVRAFIDEKVSYQGIATVVRKMLAECEQKENPSLQEILATDKSVKEKTAALIENGEF